MLRPTSTACLDELAKQLLQEVVASSKSAHGFSSMTCSVYDTAWLAMVTKPVGLETYWLFPECFTYLLNQQNRAGGWDQLSLQERQVTWEDNISNPDSIIHTLAALLALKRHDSETHKGCLLPEDIESRISRATTFVRAKLQVWNVEKTVHFGFQLLIPIVLKLLEDHGISFDFPGRNLLQTLNREAISKFDATTLYKKSKTAPLCSLEAFIGKVDFGQVAHHLASGNMMASPASTAAFLIYSPTWNRECEAFLRHIIQEGYGKGSGGVTGVFPLTIFELTWVITGLLDNGFTMETLGHDHLAAAADLLQKLLATGGGTVGFAPSISPDADDTAKTITVLSLLGAQESFDELIKHFEVKDNFRTFSGDPTPSISVHSNILSALIQAPRPSTFLAQIKKCAQYLCQSCDPDGKPQDKWVRGAYELSSDVEINDWQNLSEYYCTLHFAKSLVGLLFKWSHGSLPSFPEDLLNAIQLSLFRVLTRILQSQNADGSWGRIHSREETAYAVISIANIMSLPSVLHLSSKVNVAIELGRHFLYQSLEQVRDPDNLWTGKVSHGVANISNAYVLAALKVTCPICKPGGLIADLAPLNGDRQTSF